MTWKELRNRVKLIKKHGVTKEQLDIDMKRYDDITNMCIALSKCSLSTSQAIENLRINIQYMRMCNFARNNKKVLIEDFTRQAIL